MSNHYLNVRAVSPEKCSRHKLVREPTYRIETERNLATAPQYFQVSVNILEGRKLVWINSHSKNSYVVVVLGNKKHRTSIKRRIEEPSYREYFIFELYMSVTDVQRSNIWLAVMEPRCCAPARLMGEATIDLGEVWDQPNHQVFHKWVQLRSRNPTAGVAGFLKVDVSIIVKGDIQVAPAFLNEGRAMNNLILPNGTEQQLANYIITVYGVFSLPNTTHSRLDNRRSNKTSSTFIKVSFCGLTTYNGILDGDCVVRYIEVTSAIQSRSNHPTYCQQINIVEMFPNMSEEIRLDVCSGDGCYSKVLASASLRLGQISYDGDNGFLPTFGPSLLHMYGTSTTSSESSLNREDGPFYRGAMLASLRIVVPYYQQGLRSTSIEPVLPVPPDNLWIMEDFCVFCPILEVSMIDRQFCDKSCGIAMTTGELPSNVQGNEEFTAMLTEIKNRKLHYTGALDVMKSTPDYGYLSFQNTFPILQLATRLPDFRFRIYRNNMINGIVTDLDRAIIEVERRYKNLDYTSAIDVVDLLHRAADEAAGNILKFLDIIQYINHSSNTENTTLDFSTELDQKQFLLQQEEAENIYQQLIKLTKHSSTISLRHSVTNNLDCKLDVKKNIKIMLADVKIIIEIFKKLINKVSDGWPDLVIWLLSAGSRVAYAKLPLADMICSVVPEQNGKISGRIQTVYLKPLKCSNHRFAQNCFCIAGKVELIPWMGLYRQAHLFEPCLPKGYRIKVKEYDMSLRAHTMLLECRVFIYKGKFDTDITCLHPAHSFVRIHTINTVIETKIIVKTADPVWNQVIKIRNMVPTSPDRVTKTPHNVLVEVFDSDLMNKPKLIGRSEVQPVVDNRLEYDFAPKLQWHKIHKGIECTGLILMSVQLLYIPETLLRNTFYTPVENTYAVSGLSETMEPDANTIELLPTNLIPNYTVYKVDIYWWGLRDMTTLRRPCVVLEMGDLILKSDVISDKSNCNFRNGRSSQTFEASLNKIHSPGLNIKLYDSCSFGRSLFLGAYFAKHPNKFVVNWLPRTEREASVKSASITASNFFPVNQLLHIKQNSTANIFNYESKIPLKKENNMNKSFNWMQMFCCLKMHEEGYPLLSTFTKGKKLMKCWPEVHDHKDWWIRYYASIENEPAENASYSNKITIYRSELERQPEFSKFKDWCSTLKFYNAKKTGIPEKDKQLYCGILKAGIAIYKWPPTDKTVAVSSSGVDLTHGYFNNYPENDPTRFLVRAYIVKGENLSAKPFSGNLDPYVAICCGKKRYEDRNNHVQKTLNPIFGKMYEFRCSLPDDYLLTVSLYDYDALLSDELIGSTTIDLEDRIYTKHKAKVGLASEFSLTGKTKWRDCYKPSYILQDLCNKNHLPSLVFPSLDTVIFNGVEYRDSESDENNFKSAAERRENICLSLLHNWHTLPLCGYHLVPEHVETRTLINSEKPGQELGKIQMWIDIFPLDESNIYIPPPINIAPLDIQDYELRVIVWQIQGISRNKSGRKVSNIFVRAWLDVMDLAQYTDVRSNSTTSDGSFNWRMIFHFQYHYADKKLVKKEKGPFTEVEERFPPILKIQVLESDSDSQDECLASLSINLNEVPDGAKSALHCKYDEKNTPKISLFSITSLRAWWPLEHNNRQTGVKSSAGIIDLELTLLPKAKAMLMPVGLGRQPPSPLPRPNRTASTGLLNWINTSNSGQQRHKIIKRFCIFVILVLFGCLVLILDQPAIL